MVCLKHRHIIYRSLLYIHILTICMLTCFACSDDIELPQNNNNDFKPESGYLVVKLKCGENTTRAQEPGIKELNENRIKNVTLCLTPSAGDRTDDNEPVYFNTFTDLDEENEAILRVPLTMELITRLFKEDSNSDCRVFAAVNVEVGNDSTIAQLRSHTVNSTFASKQKQDFFAMDGDSRITYNEGGNYAIGEVTVKRSAAKITLALNVDDSVQETINGQVLNWTPNMGGITVKLQQGVGISTLDPNPVAGEMPDDVYFNSHDDLMYTFENKAQSSPYEAYDYVQSVPFYTYPNEWTDSPTERHGTFMLLSVPWSNDGGKTWRTCYYHVPIVPADEFMLVRNISYHVNLHVGMLGSFIPEEPIDIDADYYVADWGQENIDVDIKNYRYLVVDQNDYTVNNETEISIPFYTSHETIVTEVQMKFYRYNFSDQGSEFAVSVSKEQNEASLTEGKAAVYQCDFDNKTNTLNVSHELKIWVPYNSGGNEVSLTRGLDKGSISNVRDADGRYFLDNKAALDKVLATIKYFKKDNTQSEYSRIEYVITVQHKDVYDGSSGIDRDLYKETVTIHQYPGIYITATPNYSGNLANRQYTSGSMGNTIINTRFDNINYKISSLAASSISKWGADRKLAYNYRNWDYSLGLGFPPDYFNWNPNLYLVTITQLENGTPYRIGDPRSYNVNNYLANDGAISGYTVDGGTNKVFTTEYWYYQVGNNDSGPETSQSFETVFKGQKNPLDFKADVNTASWDEYIVNGFQQAAALDLPAGQKRTLSNYYPTRENMDNAMTLAPKFRICSSYGGTSSYITRSMGRRRAAAYQELGYCAGRWRLPTFGEVEFVIKLAADKKIPRLFGTNSDGTWFYWCAQGACKVPDGTVKNPDISIVANPTYGASGPAAEPFTGDNYRDHARFVYDEWYWGAKTLPTNGNQPNNTAPIYEFTWGDEVKSNPQE